MMKKMYFVIVAAIALITFFMIYVSGKDTKKNIEFLKSYGWEVGEKEIETEEIKIPDSFDEIYKNYNLLQIKAGLDLEKYKGKKAVRYTYIVKNYPTDYDDEIRANVICVGGEPVAGDIMTVSIDGFMHSLKL